MNSTIITSTITIICDAFKIFNIKGIGQTQANPFFCVIRDSGVTKGAIIH